MMDNKRKMPFCKAQKLYGFKKTTFERPNYIKEEKCGWCGEETATKSMFCSDNCRKKYFSVVNRCSGNNEYFKRLLWRDNFVCSKCGSFTAKQNKHGIIIPVTESAQIYLKSDFHNLQENMSPDNLITLCEKCGKREMTTSTTKT